MTELNRRGSRTNLNDKGSVKLDLFKRVECQIRDVSPGGARIMMPEGYEFPEEFVLKLPQFKRARHCVRRWQSGREIGVEFKQL